MTAVSKEKEEVFNERNMRDKCVEHYEVLEKVKSLLLIPGTNVMTSAQVADFYSTYYNDKNKKDNIVTGDMIKKLYKAHQEEFDSDGVRINTYRDFLKGSEFTLESLVGKVRLFHSSGMEVDIPNRGIRVFPRRAILRIGMFLRNSIVAKEVRTQLLNIEEKTTEKIKLQDINEEQRLMLNVGMAYASGNIEAVMKATTEYNAFQNRHIQKLKDDNKQLDNDNKALSIGILEWEDRSKLNAGIRMLANRIGKSYGEVWNELYKNLQYKHSICLKMRGGSPYIQWVRQNEWKKVIKTFCAMCEAYKQSPTEMFQQATPMITY